jgi:hypothetical protein
MPNLAAHGRLRVPSRWRTIPKPSLCPLIAMLGPNTVNLPFTFGVLGDLGASGIKMNRLQKATQQAPVAFAVAIAGILDLSAE